MSVGLNCKQPTPEGLVLPGACPKATTCQCAVLLLLLLLLLLPCRRKQSSKLQPAAGWR